MIMAEAEGRAAIVAEALTWIGTPYAPDAAIKGVGIDCAQLPLAVYQAVGLIDPAFKTGFYPQEWHIHRDRERLLGVAGGFGKLVPLAEIKPGDLLAVKYLRVFSHAAIYIGERIAVHASQRSGRVGRANIDKDVDFVGREIVAFSYWT